VAPLPSTTSAAETSVALKHVRDPLPDVRAAPRHAALGL
jgi:hypothetical protein